MNHTRRFHPLPIVTRELRVAGRRRTTYWSRSLAAIAAILVLAVLSLEATQVSRGTLGTVLFSTLAALFGIVAAVAGVRYTADCLSEEKRDGTLGLLFLTDLRGYDVVLGKLTASSVNAFYGLLAILPVLAVTFLLGGVSLAHFGRVTLVLINTLFFSLSVGLCVSSLSRDARKAMSATLLIVLLVVGGLPALFYFLVARGAVPELVQWILLPSPGHTLSLAPDVRFASQPATFWLSLAAGHFLGWCFLVAACLAAPHTWQDRSATARFQSWRHFFRRLLLGPPDVARQSRGRLLDKNPCLWLGTRHPLRQYFLWLFLGLLGALWFLGWLKWETEWIEIEVTMITAFTLHLFLKLAVASEAAQRLGPERQQRTLELLLATPLSVAEILRGHMMALRRQFLGPVLAVLFFDLVLFILGFRASSHWSASTWTSLAFVGVCTFLVDLYALGWTGLWTGLAARYANRAAGQAVARVLVLPWILWIGLLLISANSRRTGSGGGGFLQSWFAISLFTSVLFIAWSRSRLHGELRELAAIPAAVRLQLPWSRWFTGAPTTPRKPTDH